jgi:hypothetical protein
MIVFDHVEVFTRCPITHRESVRYGSGMYVVGANAAPSYPEDDRWHTTTQEAFMNHAQTLVADDDPSIRLLLAATLEFAGLEVQTAPSLWSSVPRTPLLCS